MKQSRHTDWKHRAGALAAALMLMGCASAAPTAPEVMPTASPATAGPRLTVTPPAGTLNSQLTLDGAGFPASTRVRIRLSTQNASREPHFIGEVLTNDGGQFKLIFITPSVWPDGSPVTEQALTFSAMTLDDAVSASADYTNTAGAPAQGNTPRATSVAVLSPSISLSPASGGINTPVTARASGFPANTRVGIRLGLPGAGAGPQVYATATTGPEGNVTVTFAIPPAWPDGKAITENVVIVVASTDDGRNRAIAEFSLSGAAPSSGGERTPAASTPVATTIATPTVPRVTLTPTLPLIVDGTAPATPDPIQASVDFLYSLLRDPSGASSVAYLSQRLRTEISNNWALPTGLGIQPGYNSFEVIMLSKAEDSAVIRATMTYESGASMRSFTLIKEAGNWRIDKVVAGGI